MRQMRRLRNRLGNKFLRHFGKYYDKRDGVKIVSFLVIAQEMIDVETEKAFYIMLEGMYASQGRNRKEYFDTPFNTEQRIQLERWEESLRENLEAVKKDYIRKLIVLLYYTSDTLCDIINIEIGRVLYSQKGETIRGMGGRVNQVFTTQYTRGRSLVISQCFDEMKAQGESVRKQWVYTYESKNARTSHLHADGLLSDEDGNFIIDGQLTQAPTMFGNPAQDYNCKCTMKLVHEPNQNR